MHKNHKTGFTLVELMVVIVIMGILAGVAIPKLTNSVTKAKASEVAPAANTYIKLQNAYVMEKKRIGSWRKIGYTKPKSDVFTYDKADISTGKSVADLGESGLVGWKATNKAPLGGCTSNNEWTVTILNKGADSDGNIQLEYKSDVSSSECAAISGDWGVVGGNTQVASSGGKTFSNPFSTSLYQASTDADGVLSLSKAIISGKSSDNMTNVYKDAKAGVEEKTFSAQYGVQGYVLNFDAGSLTKETEVKTWLKDQIKESSNTDYVKIVSALDTDDGELIAGKVYRGTQSLYYGTEQDGLDRIDLYGTRDVYAVYDGTKVTYYTDAALTQVIDLEKDTNWNKYTSDLADPMDVAWTTSEKLTKTASGDLGSAILSDGGSKNDGFNEINGIAGYVLIEGASGQKAFLTEAGISRTSNIKLVTEIHSDYKDGLTPGSVYAATQILYYGDESYLSAYGTRDVYALVTGTGVKYFTDLECTEEVSSSTTTGWNELPKDDTPTTQWCSDGYEEKSPLIQGEILKANYTATDAKYPMTQAIFSGWSVGHKNLVKKDGTSSDWNSLYGVEGYVVAGPSGTFMSEVINSANGYGTPKFIRSMTELHTTDKTVEVGKKYDATITMYYGSVDKVNSYGTAKKVCAVGDGSNNVVTYYDISECSKTGDPTSTPLNTTSASFWTTKTP